MYQLHRKGRADFRAQVEVALLPVSLPLLALAFGNKASKIIMSHQDSVWN